jgi:hypothetical protein
MPPNAAADVALAAFVAAPAPVSPIVRNDVMPTLRSAAEATTDLMRIFT